ncbi:DNA-binding transcriptional ArsR family regulator [Roseovarius sp. MBR-51]
MILLRDMAKYDPTLDLCFSALGDPTRRMILQRLAQGEASVSALAAGHDMALPSVMEHLKKLEAANLITSRKKGRTRLCALSPEAFTPAQNWLSAQSAIWEGRLDRFDDYITTLMQETET